MPVPGFQDRLSHTISGLRIGLVGAGAVGSALAERLVREDVAHVLVLDPQRLEARNLATGPFLRQAFDHLPPGADEPPGKAALLVQEARRLGRRHWTAEACEIADAGWQRLAACDLLCCCTDSVLSRVEAAWAARMLRKPLVEAGVSGSDDACRYAWYPPELQAACYLCGLGEDRRAEVLAWAVSPSLGCLPLPESPSMTGPPDAVAHAAEGMMTLLDRFAQGVLPAGRAVAWRCSADQAGWTDEPYAPARSATCPWHEAAAGEWTGLPWDLPLEDSLQATNAARCVVQLAWPLCVRARCRSCDEECLPFQRLAFVRRHGVCPACHAEGCLEPLRTVDALLPGDPLRQRTPRQLGQPERHLYLLRRAVSFPEHAPRRGTGEPSTE